MPAALDRLKKRSEFLAVAAANRRWTTPGLVLQARPYLHSSDDKTDTPPTAELRVGLTATKKIGNAVKRNRARRRLRAAAAELLPSSAKPGHDYVLIGRRETLDRPYAQLLADLDQALRKARPRKESH